MGRDVSERVVTDCDRDREFKKIKLGGFAPVWAGEVLWSKERYHHTSWTGMGLWAVPDANVSAQSVCTRTGTTVPLQRQVESETRTLVWRPSK